MTAAMAAATRETATLVVRVMLVTGSEVDAKTAARAVSVPHARSAEAFQRPPSGRRRDRIVVPNGGRLTALPLRALPTSVLTSATEAFVLTAASALGATSVRTAGPR